MVRKQIEGALLDYGIPPQDHIDFEQIHTHDESAAFLVTCADGTFLVHLYASHTACERIKKQALKQGA